MKRRVVSGLMLTLMLVGALTLTSSIQIVKAETITVPEDYATIQEAINHANEGDTVFVNAGIYYENVVVNKTVSLLGENMETTIIDGSQTSDCVNVTASSVRISGFTIRNSGSRPYTAYASVRLFSSGNSILNNSLTGSWCGVWMIHNSDSNLIANNTITGNLNGISGEMLHNTKIIGNTIENNLMGIWIGPYSQNNVVSFNDISDHRTEGIMVIQSSGNTFEGNNLVYNNLGNFSAGVTIGFQEGFSYGNKFFHNNFANIGTQIKQSESELVIWDDGYPSGGNYWSDYAGSDSNHDGIGDTPYVIDSNNQDNYPLMYPFGNPPVRTYVLTVSASSGGITYPVPGNYSYSLGHRVVVGASPHPGYYLHHWELDGNNVGNESLSMTITMDTVHNLSASFEPHHFPEPVPEIPQPLPELPLYLGLLFGIAFILIILTLLLLWSERKQRQRASIR